MSHYATRDESQLFWLDAADVETLLVSLPEDVREVGPEEAERIRLKIIAPSKDDILISARAQRDSLLVYATLRINPLQYAADVDEASNEDLALLKLWKKYSVAVSKTETQPGWPESPQWPVPPVPLETF